MKLFQSVLRTCMFNFLTRFTLYNWLKQFYGFFCGKINVLSPNSKITQYSRFSQVTFGRITRTYVKNNKTVSISSYTHIKTLNGHVRKTDWKSLIVVRQRKKVHAENRRVEMTDSICRDCSVLWNSLISSSVNISFRSILRYGVHPPERHWRFCRNSPRRQDVLWEPRSRILTSRVGQTRPWNIAASS